MKNLITLFALVAVVFTSCTSSKNGLVLKRKYNKGFYVAHNHKNTNEASKQSTSDKIAVATETKKEESALIVMPTISSTLKQEVKKSEIAAAKGTAKTLVSEVKHNTVLVETKNEVASVKKTEIKVKHHALNVVSKSKKGSSSDSDLIIQVILALFPVLCLIAVFLKDGKSITNNFWLDLILHLTIYGECIFAILVVLDIINLG